MQWRWMDHWENSLQGLRVISLMNDRILNAESSARSLGIDRPRRSNCPQFGSQPSQFICSEGPKGTSLAWWSIFEIHNTPVSRSCPQSRRRWPLLHNRKLSHSFTHQFFCTLAGGYSWAFDAGQHTASFKLCVSCIILSSRVGKSTWPYLLLWNAGLQVTTVSKWPGAQGFSKTDSLARLPTK